MVVGIIYHRLHNIDNILEGDSLRKKILVLCLLLIPVSFFTLLFFPLVKKPAEFVSNRTVIHEKALFFLQDTIKYPAECNITPSIEENRTIKMGIATHTYELNFGNVPPNVTVRKIITLENNEPRPVKVKFRVYGDIKPFVSFSEEDVILKPSERREFEVKFDARELGYYTGEIDVIVKAPRYDFILPFLQLV